MYAVAFFVVASLIVGLWSGPTVAQSPATDPTLVKIDSGTVRGVAAGNVISFKGIPYATPPVDDPRWRLPQIGANDHDPGIGSASSKDELLAQFGPYADDARKLYDPRGDQTLDELKQQVFADETMMEPHAISPTWLLAPASRSGCIAFSMWLNLNAPS